MDVGGLAFPENPFRSLIWLETERPLSSCDVIGVNTLNATDSSQRTKKAIRTGALTQPNDLEGGMAAEQKTAEKRKSPPRACRLFAARKEHEFDGGEWRIFFQQAVSAPAIRES